MKSTDNLVNYAADGGILVNGSLRSGSFSSVKSVPKLADFIESKDVKTFSADGSFSSLSEGRKDVVLEEEEDFDPLAEEVPENERTNYAQTLMNLMNGIIGSGILSMPIAFLNGGWLVASIVTPIIGFISCYCIHLLLSVNVYLTEVTGKASPYDYHEVK